MQSVNKYLNLKILSILFLITIILCFIIPAGAYDYTKNGEVIPNSFHYLHNENLTFSQILTAPIDGFLGIQNNSLHTINTNNTGTMAGAISLIVLILSISGFIYVSSEIKVLEIFLKKTISGKVNINRTTIYISLFFIINASLQGMYETALGFAPLLYLLYKEYNIDEMFILKLMLYSLGVGYIGGILNPFATLIALEQAGLNLIDGFLIRLILLIILTVIVQYILIRNLKRYDIYKENSYLEKEKLLFKEKINLCLFSLPFLIMIIGLLPLKGIGSSDIGIAYLTLSEISMVFFITTFILALYNRMRVDDILDNILQGFSSMSGVIIAIGMARSIYILMYNAQISDTLIYWTSKMLADKNTIIIILILASFYFILSIAVPSSSALAFLTIPILTTTFQLININQILVVNVYLCMIGISKMVSLTSPVVIGLCVFFNVSYKEWLQTSYLEVSFLCILSLLIIYIAYLI